MNRLRSIALTAAAAFFAAAGSASAGSPIVITELMFDSYSDAQGSGGFYEYIEIQNISNAPVDLASYVISDAVSVWFLGIADVALRTLDPGEIGLIVANPAMMTARYGPGLPIITQYSGALSNGGEGIGIVQQPVPPGAVLVNFEFSPDPPWPAPRRVSGGFPLELIAPWTDPDPTKPESWRRHWNQEGTPGRASDTDRDGLDDAWETYWFGNLAQTGTADPDGDGKTNAEERAAMSPPGGTRTRPVTDVVISEIMFDSYGDELVAGSSFEYLEIQNVSNHPVVLTGYKLTSAITFDFLAGTSLAAGEAAIVAANASSFVSRYGATPRVLGMYGGSLSNTADDLVLLSPAGVELFLVPYRLIGGWPRSPGSGEGGYPLDLVHPESRPDPEDPTSWRRHWLAEGTPGAKSDTDNDGLDDAWETEFFGNLATGPSDDVDGDGKSNALERANLTDPNENAVAARQVAITEIMFDSFGDGDIPGGLYEYIELQNVSNETIDLTGWKISDVVQYTFGARQLTPGEIVLVVKSLPHFRARYGPSATVAGVFLDSISNEGEKVTLRDAAGRAVQRFVFSVAAPWPPSPAPGSGGYPLELIAPWSSPDQSEPANWRRSWLARGTPGQPFDVDGDTLEDVWEMEFFGNLSHPAGEDADADGLTNAGERARLTNPNDPDTDDDGLSDKVETGTGKVVGPADTGTNPRVADVDLDGLLDAAEIAAGTDPFDADSDDDGVFDGPEVRYGGNPLNPAILPSAPVIDRFEPDRLTIHEGETFRLDWRVRNMQGVSITPGFDGAQPAAGSRVVYPLREEVLVASGLADFTEWKFRDAVAAPPAAWREPSFNDTTWQSGFASFAGGSAKFVSESARPNTLLAWSAGGPVTCYFRHAFDLAQPVTGHHQRILLTCKDSGVVYLDGVEVARHRFGPGTITHGQRGSLDTKGIWPPYSYPLTGMLPHPGRNVLAVEAHAAPPGGDAEGVAFDLALVNALSATGSLKYVLRAQNPYGATTKEFTIQITVPAGPAVTFTGWAAARFTPEQLTDTAVSGAGADPDNDGSSNLVEFLSGTLPLSASSVPAPLVSNAPGGAGKLISFRRVRLPQSAQLTLEYSEDITTWHGFDDAGPPRGEDLLALESIRDNGDGTETVNALLSNTVRRVFLRLRGTGVP